MNLLYQMISGVIVGDPDGNSIASKARGKRAARLHANLPIVHSSAPGIINRTRPKRADGQPLARSLARSRDTRRNGFIQVPVH